MQSKLNNKLNTIKSLLKDINLYQYKLENFSSVDQKRQERSIKRIIQYKSLNDLEVKQILNRLVELNLTQIHPEIHSERLDFVLQYNNEDIGHLVMRSISTNFNENNLEILFIPTLEKVDYNAVDLTGIITLLLGYKEYSFVTGVLDNDQYWKMCASLIPSRLCTESDHLANIDELYLSQAPEAPISFQEYLVMEKSEHGQGKS